MPSHVGWFIFIQREIYYAFKFRSKFRYFSSLRKIRRPSVEDLVVMWMTTYGWASNYSSLQFYSTNFTRNSLTRDLPDTTLIWSSLSTTASMFRQLEHSFSTMDNFHPRSFNNFNVVRLLFDLIECCSLSTHYISFRFLKYGFDVTISRFLSNFQNDFIFTTHKLAIEIQNFISLKKKISENPKSNTGA